MPRLLEKPCSELGRAVQEIGIGCEKPTLGWYLSGQGLGFAELFAVGEGWKAEDLGQERCDVERHTSAGM